VRRAKSFAFYVERGKGEVVFFGRDITIIRHILERPCGDDAGKKRRSPMLDTDYPTGRQREGVQKALAPALQRHTKSRIPVHDSFHSR